MLLDDVCRIVGGKWLDEFCREDNKENVALLLGKGLGGVCNRVIDEVGKCVVFWLGGDR